MLSCCDIIELNVTQKLLRSQLSVQTLVKGLSAAYNWFSIELLQHLVLQQALIAQLNAVAHSIIIQVGADLMSLVLGGFRWSFSFDSIGKSWIEHPVIAEGRKCVILRLM